MPEGIPTIQPAKTVEYETPKDLFDELWEEVGGFDLDPCCRPEHYTAQRVLENGGKIYVPTSLDILKLDMYTAAQQRVLYDGLAQPWHGRAAWMNPPYGPALRLWIPKAVHEVECGNVELVMALLPAKTEVRWWHECVVGEVHQPGPGTGWLFDGHRLCRKVRFIKSRLKFGGGEGPARVGNVIVVWRK